MNESQARGYIFEKVIFNLLEDSGYIKIKTGNLEGRGADHQIDAYGILEYPTAFTYPIRLIAEAKYYSRTVELGTTRNFFGVIQDISENYWIFRENGIKKRNKSYRHLETGCLFSYGDFSSEAQNYAWAHNIFLVSFQGLSKMGSIRKYIDNFIIFYKNKNELKISDNLKEKPHEKFTCSIESLKENFDEYLKSESGDLKSYNYPTLAVGNIDNIYPVILVGKAKWTDKILVPENTDEIIGEKIERIPKNNEYVFRLLIPGKLGEGYQEVSFNVQNEIAINIIDQIDHRNKAFDTEIFELNIPIKKWHSETFTRRILKIKIIIPGDSKDKYYKDLSPQMDTKSDLSTSFSNRIKNLEL